MHLARAYDSMTVMSSEAETIREARVLAGWALGGAALFVAPLSMAAVGWLREQLRFGCWPTTQGEGAGSWSCGDGIVLLSVGVPMLVLCGLALLGALICILAGPRAPRVLLPLAGLIAAAPTVVTGLLLQASARATDAAIAASGGAPPAESALALWTRWGASPALATAFAAVAVAIAASLLVSGRAPNTARGLTNAGVSLMLLSCVASLGGTLGLAVVGAAIAFAATRVAAAIGRELEAGRRADLRAEAAASRGSGE